MVNILIPIKGYVHLYRSLLRFYDMPENEIKEMLYAKRAHESGNVYAADIDDLRTRLDELWETADGLLRGFANIP